MLLAPTPFDAERHVSELSLFERVDFARHLERRHQVEERYLVLRTARPIHCSVVPVTLLGSMSLQVEQKIPILPD